MNETDVYRELAPPPALRGSLACLWVRRGGGPTRVIPDGCVDIVWRAGAGASVAGPDTAFWLSPVAPGGVIVGARFRPGIAGGALALPLSSIRDQRVAVDALALGLAARGGLAGEADPSAVLDELVRAVSAMVAGAPPDPAVQEAVRRLSRPGQRVDELAGDLGLSERQLRRRFDAAIGYGPKTLARVLRLHRFLRLGAAAEPGVLVSPATAGVIEEEPLARAAADTGYADQAHLTRECRALTGLTPAQLRDPPGYPV